MGIFHCLVLVKKHNVTDVDSAFAISESMQDIGLETLFFFKKNKNNKCHTCVSASPQNFRKRPSKFSVLGTVQPDSVTHTAWNGTRMHVHTRDFRC
jgi:hypothetical protein